MDTNAEGRDLVDEKRQQFGNRHLTDDKNVFEFNAWYCKDFKRPDKMN